MDPTAPEKNGSRHNPQPGRVIHMSATQFLFQHSHWSSNESQASIDEQGTLDYWAHNTSMWSVHSILARGGQPIGP
jgi:hypothetical protein